MTANIFKCIGLKSWSTKNYLIGSVLFVNILQNRFLKHWGLPYTQRERERERERDRERERERETDWFTFEVN